MQGIAQILQNITYLLQKHFIFSKKDFIGIPIELQDIAIISLAFIFHRQFFDCRPVKLFLQNTPYRFI
jgi:hypothetical protein